MISAVSSISFKGDNGLDLISSPGRFSQQITPQDVFERPEEKKSNKGLASVIGAAIIAIGSFIGLGYAFRKGSLKKVDVEATEGTLNKLWARIKNAGTYIGEKADNCYTTISGWFGKETNKVKTENK